MLDARPQPSLRAATALYMWQHADDFLPFMTLDNGDQMTLGNRGAAPWPLSSFMVADVGHAYRVRIGFGTL